MLGFFVIVFLFGWLKLIRDWEDIVFRLVFGIEKEGKLGRIFSIDLYVLYIKKNIFLI